MTERPISIYQIFTRLFSSKGQKLRFGTIQENGCAKFSDFTPKALQAIKDLGVTHVWYTGLLEHATVTDYSVYGIKPNHPSVVKGRAGSPYAIRDYYDICPDFADSVPDRMEEFEQLVQRTHAAGLKMIIDFVPNHVARQYGSDALPAGHEDLGAQDDTDKEFHKDNNFYYLTDRSFVIPWGTNFPYINAYDYNETPAKATGNDSFTHTPSINDWYETVKINYGIDYQAGMVKHFHPVPNTWQKMLSILLFWADKGVDGFRCDMAEMVPVEFWGWAISKVKDKFPAINFIAEVYNPFEYRNFIFNGKFDYLYDKVGLYDILRALMEGHGTARELTTLWQQYEGISQYMLRFLENHDEQRIASSQFAGSYRPGIPGMVLCATLSTGPVMTYFGQEIGEPADESEGFSGHDGRTTIFDYWSLDRYQKWVNNGNFDGANLSSDEQNLRAFYQRLLNLKLTSPALAKGLFYDLMWSNPPDPDRVFLYLRHCEEETLMIAVSFDQQESQHFIVQFPEHAYSHLSLPRSGYFICQDMLGSGKELTFKAENMTSEGFAIQLAPLSAYIFRFEKFNR